MSMEGQEKGQKVEYGGGGEGVKELSLEEKVKGLKSRVWRRRKRGLKFQYGGRG